MKKTIKPGKILHSAFIPILLFLFCSNLLPAQVTLLGSWKVTKEFEKTLLPKTITFDLHKDSVILIRPASDSLNYTTILSADSTKATIKNSVIDAKSNKFTSYYGKTKLVEGGKKLIVEYIQEKTQQKKIVEYDLILFYCSNHSPAHCTTSSADIPTMTLQGCTGIQSK